MNARRRPPQAFTLLEITVSIFLLMLLLTVGLPSLVGQLSRQKLQGTFDRFDALVVQAQNRSISEGRAYQLLWSRDGSVRLYPADLSASQRTKTDATLSLLPSSASGGEKYSLVRNSSLAFEPAPVWTFWPTGTCEPVGVRYQGPSGAWEALYNPLSGRAVLDRFSAR